MTTPIRTFISTSMTNILGLALLSSLIAAAPVLAESQTAHDHSAPARLVQIVRDATQQFIDVNNTMGRHSAASAVRTMVPWAFTISMALW